MPPIYNTKKEEILKIYKNLGFDANQDVPGSLCWEELYNASPKGTKVILTVRDDDYVWHRNASELSGPSHDFRGLYLYAPRFCEFYYESNEWSKTLMHKIEA